MDSAFVQWEEKLDRKHQDWFDPNDQELQTILNRRDKAHQRGLQTRSTRSTTTEYMQTATKTEVRLVGNEESAVGESC